VHSTHSPPPPHAGAASSFSAHAASPSPASVHGAQTSSTQTGFPGSVHSSLPTHPVGPVSVVGSVVASVSSVSVPDIDIELIVVGSPLVLGVVSLIDTVVVGPVLVSATPSQDGSSSNV
jgi:hypothetical protein